MTAAIPSSHADDHDPVRTSKGTRIVLGLLLVPFVVATIVGGVALWPDSRKHTTPDVLGPAPMLVDGEVRRVVTGPCVGDPSENRCDTVTVLVDAGPDRGSETLLTLQEGPGQPGLEVGDEIVLGRTTDTVGAVNYYFADFQRKAPLAVLGLVFAVLVVLVARWRGIGSLVGLGFTWLAITQFMLPSILEGRSPVAVALVCGSAVMLVVLYVAHGPSARTTTAVIGTLASLALTGVLAWIAIRAAHITGMSSDEATYVQTYAGEINIEGLLLAGMIIGSLGVLNDMTVTQASAVWEIHAAQPLRRRRDLYRSSMRVGRDHIASTVYTLVLAYVGATLPLLILFTLTNRQAGDVFASDVIGEEVVRSLVGAIGLILSVPITTGLAAIVAGSQRGDGQLAEARGDDATPAPADSEHEESKLVESGGDIEPTLEGGQHEESDVTGDEVIDLTLTPAGTSSRSDFDGRDVALSKKPRRRLLPKRRVPSFEETRKMSRRERRFWQED